MTAIASVRRDPTAGLVSGVAAGLAARTGIDVTVVRLGFLVLTLAGGAGIPVYVGLHLMLPDAGGRPAETSTVRAIVLGVASLIGAGVVRGVGFVPFSGVTLPLVVALVGGTFLWRQVRGDLDLGDRPPAGEVLQRLVGAVSDPAARDGRTDAVRAVVGGALVIVGVVSFVAVNNSWATVGPALGAAVVAMGGVALLALPWLWRLASELTTERRARIRSEERAEMAAHLHDSVLQTLTLIQRHPERTEEVARLARRQERELRTWLRDPDRPLKGHLSDGLRRAAEAVEDDHGVTVDLVTVGDAAFDDGTAPLVAATAEALRNAAKHSGTDHISVFVEVVDGVVEVFVRDRGVGFDPEHVPADRHGLSDSIRGRMERAGGTVEVRTAPGEGTEVRLHLPVGRDEPEIRP